MNAAAAFSAYGGCALRVIMKLTGEYATLLMRKVALYNSYPFKVQRRKF
jgi:hypothetical protein